MSEQEEQIQNIAAEVARRQSEHAAQFVKNTQNERQRALASKTLGKKVFDVIEFHDVNGDDVMIWVFADLRTRDLVENSTVVVMLLLLEQNRNFIRFEEVTFREGRFWLQNNENLVIALQRGSYSF